MKRKLLLIFIFSEFFIFSLNKQVYEFSLKKKKGKYILEKPKKKTKSGRKKIKKKSKKNRKLQTNKNRKLLTKDSWIMHQVLKIPWTLGIGAVAGARQIQRGNKYLEGLRKFDRIWKVKIELIGDINEQLNDVKAKLKLANQRWDNWLGGTEEKLGDVDRELTNDFRNEKQDLQQKIMEEGILKRIRSSKIGRPKNSGKKRKSS